MKLLDLYSKLSDSVKRGCVNIFDTESEETLKESLKECTESYWEYCRYLRNEHRDEEFVPMLKILEESVILTDYSFQGIEVGDDFDSFMYHSRDNRSAEYSGDIVEVALDGLVRDGKLVKKAIVLI